MGNSDAEVDKRCAHNPTVKRTIVQELQMFLHQNNNLVNMFKIALDRMPSDSHNIVIRADKTPAGEHTRRFNSPTIDEVAVVIVGENLQSRDIVLHRRNIDLKRVSETHRTYNALQYPLIFWLEEDGYHFNIKMVNQETGAETNKKVSAMNFYSYRLMIREGEVNHILMCRRLFHQFAVDRRVLQQAQQTQADSAQKQPAAAAAPAAPAQQCNCACSCGKKSNGVPSLFVDEEFPARWNVLYNPSEVVAWLRPHEIRTEPRLFLEDCSRFGVQQGCLEDGWFIAACAAVAEWPELLKRLVPEGQVLHGPGYDGSVRFRFWHLGEWKEVRVDDRLPVDAKGVPVYARCQHRDEFWLPLLEKAFAKFQGSYRFLHQQYGDTLSEGFINLTGYCLDNFSTDKWDPEYSFHRLKEAFELNAMILCRTEHSAPGLPSSHAYTVTKVFHRPIDKEKNNEEEMRMVRVRNSWGTAVEWTGAWKSGDERWNKLSNEIKADMEYTPEVASEFWMDAKDFSDNFTTVCFAMEKPKEALKMKAVGQITDHWNEDFETGGNPDDIEKFAKNPQFLLVALGAMDPENEENKKEKEKSKKPGEEETKEEENKEEPFNPMAGMEAVVELLQEHNRKKRTWKYDISYYIFETCAERRLTAEQMLQMTYVTGATGFRDETGVRSLVRLHPGRRYVIIPTTRCPGDEGDFLLRVFSRHARVRLTELPA